MNHLNLNGVEVAIATQIELEQAGVNPADWRFLDDAGALFLQPLPRLDALRAAGFDQPQACVNENCRGRVSYRIEHWAGTTRRLPSSGSRFMGGPGNAGSRGTCLSTSSLA